MNDRSSVDTSSASSKLTTDITSDNPTTAVVLVDSDDPVIEVPSVTDESTEADNRSSLLFVDLVETLFMKKDSKPVPTIIKEGSLHTEEIPLLPTTDKPESDTQTNPNSDEMTSTVD
jgi:hypothetical protein